jgi:hypothetical protein
MERTKFIPCIFELKAIWSKQRKGRAIGKKKTVVQNGENYPNKSRSRQESREKISGTLFEIINSVDSIRLVISTNKTFIFKRDNSK